ncbi:tyrosine-type recombinase/integrase [Ralstonia pseudosolanacearum]|uniref:tyrosine-type recombinase/integrase n=1 Tax=Ralstonia pseudosolanacearum TaxID=1310165 RepID=UPI003CFA10BC
MTTSPAAAVPTRAQYAAVRAWLQGVRPAAVASRWLSADPDAEWTDAEALRALRAIRTALAQLALRHSRGPLAKLLTAGTHGAAAVDTILIGLRELERLGSPAPALTHGVQLWFAAPLARRLANAGVRTLGELMTLANELGAIWWRRVPRVGRHAAATVVRTLVAAEATLGRLGAHVTGAALPAPLLAPPLTPTALRAVPLEAMCLPAQFDGSAGCNRGEPARCRINADHDYAAIQTWLSLWPAGSHTWRAYRKEAERFLAWAILERNKAFSDLLTDDCLAYRAFLAQPERGPRWSGPPVARHLPGWRPFQGALAPRTRAYAEQVLSALCAWLVGRHYLDSNPWEGVPALRVAQPVIDIERAVPEPVWQVLVPWLAEQAAGEAQWRTIRAAVLLLRDSGMRIFEAAGAERSELRPLTGDGPLWGELRIVGKRNKARWVPVSRRAYDALAVHWRDRGVEHTGEGPLLVPAEADTLPRARAKTAAGRLGYSDRGLRKLVYQAAEALRDYLEQAQPDLVVQAEHLHPHAFRHAFGTAATEAGVPVDVVQSYLGHASTSTTALYNKAGARRRQHEITKLLAQ